MPVDLATADLLMGANNGPSASAISVADDLTAINSYGSLTSFGSVTATDVTLAEADNLPASVDYFTLIDTVEGLQVPMPVDLDTGSLLLAAQNSSQTYISVTDDLTNFTDFPAGFLSNFMPPITVTGVTLADVPGPARRDRQLHAGRLSGRSPGADAGQRGGCIETPRRG